MSEDNKKEDAKQAEAKPATGQVNDLQPIVAGFKAKLLAGKAKVNSLIAEKAPVVKDALVKSLDKLADSASESKEADAKAVADAEAEAAELKAKADAQKAAAPAPKAEEKPAKEEAEAEAPKEEAAKDDPKEVPEKVAEPDLETADTGDIALEEEKKEA